MQTLESGLQVLDEQELEAVGGGWRSVIVYVAERLSAAAGDYLRTHAGGGADEGTWESIGRSQMTA